MIEFKAECGHTVRAKDEDEGKVVRCTYCGREAQVPSKSADDELDFLFSEVEKTGVYDVPTERQRRKRMRSTPKVEKARTRSDGQALSIVLKLCYAGIIICVLIFVGKKAFEHIRSPGKAPPIVGQTPKPPQETSEGVELVPPPAPVEKRGGLLHKEVPAKGCGLYVASVPRGAQVIIAEAGTVTGSILTAQKVERHTSGDLVKLDSGSPYDVYVALPESDLGLMSMPGYEHIRHKLTGRDRDDEKLLCSYFLPDGAVECWTDRLSSRNPIMIVRKYECIVFDPTWEPLVALFLPQGPIERFIRFVPHDETFGFELPAVETELDFRGITNPRDREDMIDMLRRVGVAPYRSAASDSYLLFSVMLDGEIRSTPVPLLKPRR
jgi:hypothetical protein